jgi:prevent-host-death family protein
MVYNMDMIMVNIYEAKSKLSEFIEAATRGERVIICNHNQPVAELRAVEPIATGSRDLAPMFPGQTWITPAFFEPLSAKETAAWEGIETTTLKAAESRGTYDTRKKRPRKGART